MPLTQDPEGGGTTADGSRSQRCFSYCYQNGRVPGPAQTAAEMQAFCIERMRQGGWPHWLAWIATRDIPRLERWKNG